ncbi:MAG: isoprenylcysteine carboxylmethyltransferase family protein [Thermoanaerobaculia bacterium]
MTERDTPGVIAPPPLLFMLALAAGLLVQAYWPLVPVPADLRPVAAGVGGFLIAVALVVLIAAERTLQRAGTPVEPWKPTTALVTAGPYALSRNPIYVSLLAAFLGVALILDNGWLLLAAPGLTLALAAGVIRREERYLARRFPGEYAAYRSRVRRWL